MPDATGRKGLGTSVPRAATLLRRGGLIAFPTETFYGLAVDPFCRSAVARLFRVKQRPADKPLLLLIDRVEQLQMVAAEIPEAYRVLMKRYWPGPLTMVFPARGDLPEEVTGYTGTVGVRISPHPAARELVRQAGRPITATSANPSGHPPVTSAREVLTLFPDGLDYILDGGNTPGGLSSTVIGVERGKIVLLRRGALDLDKEG